MAPHTTTIATEDQLKLIPDKSHECGHELEERTLSINLSGIVNDLKNLDYSKVVWRNLILFAVLHIYGLYGVYLAFTSAMWKTLFFSYFLYVLSAFGITMGVHRLWAHRSYKAKLPLRTFLAFCNTLAFQNDIYDWARDHRVHHKYSETDADPHNAVRGFFFAHMGWLMYKKHPDVLTKGKTIDMSDVLNDPVVEFQRKHYKKLVLLVCFVMPTVVPMLWGENWVNGLLIPGFVRYLVTLHITWMVNSLAHWVGSKPYDKAIYPSQNKVVAALALGEGWHNYHHVFPFDYRTSEFGGFMNLNMTTLMIDMCAKLGLAYDLKVVDKKVIEQRIKRTGESLAEKVH